MKINADMMNLKEAPLFKNQTQIEGQREREGEKKGKSLTFSCDILLKVWRPTGLGGQRRRCVRERESTERDEHRNIVF